VNPCSSLCDTGLEADLDNLNWSQESYARAYRFAAHAHLGQKYPGTDLPYVVHVSLVSMEVIAALCVERDRNGDLAVQCALLHDVIEDTDVTVEQLRAAFGERVTNGVLALSKDSALPKAGQMADSLSRIRQQPHEVWLVKLADRIANLAAPPHYWTMERRSRYREEAVAIHTALHPASAYLGERLFNKIDAYGSFL
jgi:(p)ppGpp synthase/HD superfamily hydrolase